MMTNHSLFHLIVSGEEPVQNVQRHKSGFNTGIFWNSGNLFIFNISSHKIVHKSSTPTLLKYFVYPRGPAMNMSDELVTTVCIVIGVI